VSEVSKKLKVAIADRYVIERELGQGGMATVYLARDVKHERNVALKVLRPELAAVLGGERFVQEIKTTANLQHPHILALFDSGEAGGFLYYVMPYVEGETLRDKLDRETQLGIEEAVQMTVELADALDYAHRQGVIHRDIKPENILLHDGRPMVADFGIALAVSAAAGGRMTETGLSLGTPHYMSPEQATAEKELTPRSDVYSLASVLYEMLTGNPPHVGATAQQIIMKIVTEEAQPVTAVRKSVPPQVAGAVAKALERLPADRFGTAHEFAEALQGRGAVFAPTGTQAASPSGMSTGWRARLRDPMVLVPSVVALAAVAASPLLTRSPDVADPVPPIRFVMSTTATTQPNPNWWPWPAAISPDGGAVVYNVATADDSQLHLLRTDQLVAQPIPGTEGAMQPYFSPDGAWLAFEVGGKHRKVRLDGSAPVTVADASAFNGADWTDGGEIILGAIGPIRGLARVSAAGGEPLALTYPDTMTGELEHLWPIAVPGETAVVFVIWSGSLASSELAIASLDDGSVARLGIEGIRPLAVLDGMLVYVQDDGAVMAVALDARSMAVVGRPIPVHDPVQVHSANNGNSGIFVSRGGALVVSRGQRLARLASVRPSGAVDPMLPEARELGSLALSPDGRRIAVVLGQGRESDVWIYDRRLGTFARLTTLESVTSVNWAADGSHVVFTATGDSARGAVWKQLAAGGAPPEKLMEHPLLTPWAVMAPDGQSLLVTSLAEGNWSVFRVPLDSGGVVRPYVATLANEYGGHFSPDGRWVAVASDESGRDEVYVRSFPDPSSKVQVSVTGGVEPIWAADGTRLFYRSGSGTIIAARVALGEDFTLLGRDTVATGVDFANTLTSDFAYDSADGSFVVLTAASDAFDLVIAPNWITEFRRRVADAR
jgi:serine/threonine-protein kinase